MIPAVGAKFTLPILTYHSIDKSGSVISTSPEMFRTQMECLCEFSYSTISLRELVLNLRARREIPPRTVVITFDDGFKNFHTEAFPVLRKLGFKATVFLVTDYCERDNYWPGQWAGVERLPLLSWKEIIELHKEGIEFGSHTATHPDLTRTSVEQADQEIKRSKAAIEDHLGAMAATFAYPYGRYNTRVRGLVQKEFLGAGTTEMGRVNNACDLHSLKRVDMYYFRNLALFKALLRSRADWYINVRQSLREMKDFLQRRSV